MALPQLFTVLAIAMAFSSVQLTSCSVVKSSVLCTDCDPGFDFSGIRVVVKCDQSKKLSIATTDKNGGFETELLSNGPLKCLAKLVGGPSQLYALKKDMVSKVVMAHDEKTYTLLTPLAFSKSCHGKCGSPKVGSSKTIDLPIPPEYGLPPTSYYTPFIPIIGIP